MCLYDFIWEPTFCYCLHVALVLLHVLSPDPTVIIELDDPLRADRPSWSGCGHDSKLLLEVRLRLFETLSHPFL